jgi:hypothetical protein
LNFGKLRSFSNPFGDGESLGFVQFHARSLNKLTRESSFKRNCAIRAQAGRVAQGLRGVILEFA